MKRLFFVIIFAFFIDISFAQDTTRIVFSQEADTLVKQRFIDRYENVFMTKVPTRHMFKIGLSQYYQAIPLTLSDNELPFNSSLHLGYEFKFLPSFSLAIAGHFPYFGTNIPLAGTLSATVMDAQIRWFYDMRKRIKSGRSANNFSGNYVAINYTVPGTYQFSPHMGIKLGFQRRFLNSGFMDFAIALQQEVLSFDFSMKQNLTLSSQASFGFAFGDWKRTGVLPLCDLLLCDETITDQWKIRFPELTFGYYLNRARIGIGYERKISQKPFSLNFQFDLGLNRGFNYIRSKSFSGENGGIFADYSHEAVPRFTFQPRYYITQKRRRLQGKSGNGLSGIYTGMNSEYSYYFGRHEIIAGLGGDNRVIKKHIINAGLLLGMQQRLFSHGYLDFNTSLNYQNQSATSTNHLGLKANLAIGLAI